MKKVLNLTTVLLLVFSLVLLAACGGSGSSAPSSQAADSSSPASAGGDAEAPDEGDGEGTGAGVGKRIALITTIGGLGDGAIGDACYHGILAAQEVLGFEMDYSEPMSAPDYESLIIEYAESGDYDLIFLAGNDGLDPVNAVGGDYPDQKFVVYDISADGNEQYVSEFFAKNEIGFMAGVFAALLEEQGEVTIAGETTTFETTGKIGLMIGNEVPSTVNALTGAAAGIHYINPDYEYLYGIVGDWKDQAKNKELALSIYDQGAHFIFQNAGGGALGIIAAAQERGQFFIGYDTDQTEWAPELVVGSSRKANDATILRVLETFCTTGQLPWGVAEENNASNGGIMFTYNPDLEVSSEMQAIMDQVFDDLKTGKITSPNTWEEVEAFTDVLER
ncbi:BMP family ABC transporter substrate-binding protein [Ruminococcaceae bacterium OttesenSCG-928-D13]|nr:BMP family ABC transporter substrate-binding protein [Ruminococcaceae bacterium OttesenSCG-928-D13]